ncbi:MAG: UDP-N-acetylmuramoyl-tripeptide--D-alanyl-D-alanine ligase [Candidatus Saccharibacteria bacterium]|nr:UDP-N-acetylmuramoyl-tripeptide--D-alanyl-D-alanine ligase [Candidatus Saccharibacteria bacterium]
MKLFKRFVLHLLQKSVRQLFRANPSIKLIIVVGSVGKTSTKSAIVDILSTTNRVRTNRGNFNAELSAPLEILGVDGPSNPRSLPGWLRTVITARRAARRQHDIDIIVQECGIDRPGEMAAFASYLRPDITVITAISPEHMEFFGDLTTVAREEFGLSAVSKQVIYNHDDIDPSFVAFAGTTPIISYGTTANAHYRLQARNLTASGFHCTLHHHDTASDAFAIPILGEHQLRVAAGAAAVAITCGLDDTAVITALKQFTPVPGRMQPLQGINDSLLIDDSYNSSPLAAASALRTLYTLPQSRKIAILGDMNELGDTAEAEHRALGQACDPAQLTHLITVGEMARTHLAPAAKAQGCTVTSFATAPEATELLATLATADTALLFKGSQGGIYLEEAIKPLLQNPDDSKKLVRQSPEWQEKKRRFFTAAS